jgi:hypothetical protein
MYQLVSAIVKPVDSVSRWRNMGIEEFPLNLLFRDFKRVIVTLSHTALDHHVSLELEPLRAQLGGLNKKFGQWLSENGSNTLPTSNVVPVINTRYAHFSDAVRAGHKITPTHPTISPSSPLPLSSKSHLLITKAEADYERIYKHCLVNVNGFYHQTDHSVDGVFVTDGMKTCLKGRRNEIGLLSFENLGTLSFIPITDDMIYKHKAQQQLRYNCYVDTGVDLSSKTVLLVLGGYLHTLDKRSFYRISTSAFGIDFAQIPLIDRYFESYKVLDYSSLELERSDTNESQISVSNLYQDAVLRKYLQLSQTFLVVLDNAEVFTDTVELKPSPFPGNYTSDVAPIYPLMVGHGRHEVFWPRKEHDRYSVNINARAAWTAPKNYDTVKTQAQASVSNAKLASLGFRNSSAHFQLIGSDFDLG